MATVYPGTWDFFNNGSDHEIGDESCLCCQYPYPIRCECGGLVHGHVVSEENIFTGDYDIGVTTMCDTCYIEGYE